MAPLYTTPIARDGFGWGPTGDIDTGTPDGGGSGPLAVGEYAYHDPASGTAGTDVISIAGGVGVRAEGSTFGHARYRWKDIPSLPTTYRTEAKVQVPDHGSGSRCQTGAGSTLSTDTFTGSSSSISGRGSWVTWTGYTPLQIAGGVGLTINPPPGPGGTYGGGNIISGVSFPENPFGSANYGAKITGHFNDTSFNNVADLTVFVRATDNPELGNDGYYATMSKEGDDGEFGTVLFGVLRSGTGGATVDVGGFGSGSHTLEIRVFTVAFSDIICVLYDGAVVITTTSNQINDEVGQPAVSVGATWDTVTYSGVIDSFEAYELTGFPGALGSGTGRFNLVYAAQEVAVRWDATTATGYMARVELERDASGTPRFYFYLEEWNSGSITGLRYSSALNAALYDTDLWISLEITPANVLTAYFDQGSGPVAIEWDDTTTSFDLAVDEAADTSATVALHTTGDPLLGLDDGSGYGGVFIEAREWTIYWDGGGGGGPPDVTVACGSGPAGFVRLALTASDTTWFIELERATDAMGTGATPVISPTGGPRGPAAWSVPAGVAIAAGADGQAIINANAAGTTYIVGVGTHSAQNWLPKAGDTFIGADGATFAGTHGVIMDGLGTTRYAFRRSGSGPDDVTIRGLKITRYHPLPDGVMGAVNAGGDAPGDSTSGWIIEDCDIGQHSAMSVRLGTATQVRRCRLHHNAILGFGGVGTSCVVEDNEVSYNNVGTSNADAGGCKVVLSTNCTLRNNWVHHNNGPGLWGDIANGGLLIEDNVVEDNVQEGIVDEIGYDFTIRNNTVRRNGLSDSRADSWAWGAGIAAHASGGTGSAIYGNYLEDNRHGIALLQQPRGTAHGDPSAPRADAVTVAAEMYVQNVAVHDNIVVQNLPYGSALLPVTGALADPADAMLFSGRGNSFEDDDYYITASIADPFAWDGAVRDWASWQGYGNDDTGSFTTGAGPGAPDPAGGGGTTLLPGTTTSYDDPQSLGTTWYYRARAVLGVDVGEWSAWVSCTPTGFPCEGPPENPYPNDPPPSEPPGEITGLWMMRQGLWRPVDGPGTAEPHFSTWGQGLPRVSNAVAMMVQGRWHTLDPNVDNPPPYEGPDPPPFSDPCDELLPPSDPPDVDLDPLADLLFLCGQMPTSRIGIFNCGSRAYWPGSLQEADTASALGGYLLTTMGGYKKFKVGGVETGNYSESAYVAWIAANAAGLNDLAARSNYGGHTIFDDWASSVLWPPSGISVSQMNNIINAYNFYCPSLSLIVRARPSQWPGAYPTGINSVMCQYSYWAAGGRTPAQFRDYEVPIARARGWRILLVINLKNGGTVRNTYMTAAQVADSLVQFADPSCADILDGTGVGFTYNGSGGWLDDPVYQNALALGRNALAAL